MFPVVFNERMDILILDAPYHDMDPGGGFQCDSLEGHFPISIMSRKGQDPPALFKEFIDILKSFDRDVVFDPVLRKNGEPHKLRTDFAEMTEDFPLQFFDLFRSREFGKGLFEVSSCERRFGGHDDPQEIPDPCTNLQRPFMAHGLKPGGNPP